MHRILLLVACSMIAGTTARADDFHVAATTLKQADWTFKPIYRVQADSAVRMVGLAAFADESTIVNDNLAAVLYERDSATGAWSSRTWPGWDSASIIKEIKAAYAIPDADDWLWEVKSAEEIGAAIAATGPKGFQKGLVEDDPLSQQLPMEAQRDDIVSWLKEVGYAAALVPFDKSSDPGNTCRDHELEAMSAGFEYYASHAFDEAAGFAAFMAASATADEPCRDDLPFGNNACYLLWFWPGRDLTSTLTCGPWGMTTSTYTIGVAPFTITIVSSTCYARNCTIVQRSTVMWRNICVTPNSVGVFYTYRTNSYVEGCCISGIGGPPPPLPCTPVADPPTPGPWTTTPPPGVPTGPGTPPPPPPTGP